jgi:type VI secretion system protein ImpF
MSGSARGANGARRGPPRRAQLPLLDRLLDDAPEQANDAPMSAGEALDALRRSVKRDLETLLNSRRRWRSCPPGLRELGRSALTFGIPDCSAGTFHDKRQREVLRAEIEDTLRRFEPRFASVRVALLEGGNPLDSTLRLQIDAMLHAEPAPEPIAFETVVDPTTSEVTVRSPDV